METILITDTQIPLGLHLTKRFLQEDFDVVAAPSDSPAGKGRKKPSGEPRKKATLVVPWNRPSPLSCKNLLLRAIQRFSSLNAALILLPPLPPVSPFMQIKYLDIEIVLDTWLKGSILLARDLLEYFISRRNGSIAFVYLSPPKGKNPSLLDDLCREGMLVVFKHMTKAAKAHGIKVNAFLSQSTDGQAYAEFITRTFFDKCNKTSGKLFYFQWK